MSENDVWTVLGRSGADADFKQQFLTNPDGVCLAEGYELDDGEIEHLRQALSGEGFLDWEFQRSEMRKRVAATNRRAEELGRYSVEILKKTLDHAAGTYRSISGMNKAMFSAGIALFVGAAVYGAVFQALAPFAFAGLGASTFIALFLTGAIDKCQAGLSNLVQVEIAFMNYFEQLAFWENYAQSPASDSIEKASRLLQQRSAETVDLLERFVESDSAKRRRRESVTEAEKRRVRSDASSGPEGPTTPAKITVVAPDNGAKTGAWETTRVEGKL